MPATQVQAKPQAVPATRNVAQQIRELFGRLETDEARRLVEELFDEFGPESRPAPKAVIPPKAEEPTPAAPPAEMRERVLAAVVEALSLEPRDLARVLYGEDTPSAVRRAQKTLETQRKSR